MADTRTMAWTRFGETWSAEGDDGRQYTVTQVPRRGAWRLHEFTADPDEVPRTKWYRSLQDAQRAAGEMEAQR